jgi:hypothetical protein
MNSRKIILKAKVGKVTRALTELQKIQQQLKLLSFYKSALVHDIPF